MDFTQPLAADDPTSGAMPTIADRLRRRAWSRAGAVAAVLDTAPSRLVLAMSTRLVMLFFGSFMISTAVAVTLWTQLGPGPLDVFIGAIRNITGLPLAVAVWATVGSLIVAAWILGRRPGFGTVLSPLLIGPILQTALSVLESFGAPSSILVRIGLQLAAIFAIGIGSGALIVSGLGAGSGELFAGATSDRVGHSVTRVRPLIELSWIVVGVALGGPAGLGTVMVAALIGPAVAHGHRIVDDLAARSIRGVVNTRDAIITREFAHT